MAARPPATPRAATPVAKATLAIVAALPIPPAPATKAAAAAASPTTAKQARASGMVSLPTTASAKSARLRSGHAEPRPHAVRTNAAAANADEPVRPAMRAFVPRERTVTTGRVVMAPTYPRHLRKDLLPDRQTGQPSRGSHHGAPGRSKYARFPFGMLSASRLKIPAGSLFAFDGFEEGFEVADAEAERAVAFDEFEEHRGAVDEGFGEDLQQVAVFVPVYEDAAFL